jgi:hypothetical protein
VKRKVKCQVDLSRCVNGYRAMFWRETGRKIGRDDEKLERQSGEIVMTIAPYTTLLCGHRPMTNFRCRKKYGSLDTFFKQKTEVADAAARKRGQGRPLANKEKRASFSKEGVHCV